MQKATLRVLGIQKLDVQADNSTVLDVLVELYDNEDAIEQRRLSFPLDTSHEALQEELSKFLETYNLDREQAEASKEQDAAHANADEVIGAMEGFTIGEPPVKYDTEKKDEEVKDELPADPGNPPAAEDGQKEPGDEQPNTPVDPSVDSGEASPDKPADAQEAAATGGEQATE